MTAEPTHPPHREWLGPLAVALVALVAVVLTLDAAGDYPKLFEGPGITLDESFNVQMGVYQWKALREYHVALLHPDSIREVFGPGSNYNPDHPPLGRVWLGIWHDLVEWLFPPADHPPNEQGIRFVTDCARVGSATAFALTVFLIGLFATKWYGRAAGIVAAASLALMPRVFAHAHLASLETFMNLTYSATILAVAHWWFVRSSGFSRAETQPPEGGTTNVSVLTAVLTGILFGLALLTKMQAILIPPVVGVWALWHWRTRAIKPLMIFGLVGLIVFFIGWPWLWLDPMKHFREYFARTTSRAVLNCYYFGQVWIDKDVPWHYPFVMFAITVPVGLHALGMLGVFGRLTRSASEGLATPGVRSRFGLANLSPTDPASVVHWPSHYAKSSTTLGSAMANRPPGQARWENFRWRFGFVCGPREQLLVLATLFPLVLFALPGIAVYDGERLFLISYPIWAVLIGRGGAAALGHLREKADSGQWRLVASRRARVTVATLFLLTQGIGAIVMHPCQLSYYNLLVGGLYGADRLGFERTYWGDSLTRSLLQSLFDDKSTRATVSVEPVLHQFQLPELLSQSPILRRQQVTLMAVGDVARTRKRGEQTLETPRMQLGFLRRADFSEIHAWNPKGVAADMAEKGDPFNDPRFRTVFLKRQGVILAVGASLVSEPQDSAASPSSK